MKNEHGKDFLSILTVSGDGQGQNVHSRNFLKRRRLLFQNLEANHNRRSVQKMDFWLFWLQNVLREISSKNSLFLVQKFLLFFDDFEAAGKWIRSPPVKHLVHAWRGCSVACRKRQMSDAIQTRRKWYRCFQRRRHRTWRSGRRWGCSARLSAANFLQPIRIDFDALNADNFRVWTTRELRRDFDLLVRGVAFRDVLRAFADDGRAEELEGLDDADDANVVNGGKHGHFLIFFRHWFVAVDLLNVVSQRCCRLCCKNQHFKMFCGNVFERFEEENFSKVILMILFDQLEERLSTEASAGTCGLLYLRRTERTLPAAVRAHDRSGARCNGGLWPQVKE